MKKLVTLAVFNNTFDVKFKLLKDMLDESLKIYKSIS